MIRPDIVQPLTPHMPITGIRLANEYCINPPANVTNGALFSTAPSVPSTVNTFARQLPSQTMTALISQQAVHNANLSEEERLRRGVIQGTATGVTLRQMAAPGGTIKPGADEFLLRVRQKTPNMPDNRIMSSVLFTGDRGVRSVEGLRSNVNAQVSAIAGSMQKATNELSNNGILTGKESPNQVSGVIMAASAVGVAAVTNILKNPSSLASSLSSNSEVGKLIAGGNFAGNLADKAGSPGLAASLEAFASGAAKTAIAGAAGLVSGALSVAQNAFSLAEKSFGALKGGLPNFLKGAESGGASKTALNAVTGLEKAVSEKLSAEKLLNKAKQLYKADPKPENLTALREAETALAGMEQKAQKLSSGLSVGGAAALGALGAQQLSSAASNLLPNSSNSGINVFPGGASTFGGMIEKSVSNITAGVKGLVESAGKTITGLAGNIKNNLTNLADATMPSLGSVTQGVQGLIGQGPAQLVQNIAGSLKAGAAGLMAGVAGAAGSLGKLAGGIKLPSIATDTFASVKASMDSVFNKTLDAKVPPPVFDVVAFTPKANTTQASVKAALDKTEELRAKRESKNQELASAQQQQTALILQNKSDDGSLTKKIEALSDEVRNIDKELIASHQAYFNSLRG